MIQPRSSPPPKDVPCGHGPVGRHVGPNDKDWPGRKRPGLFCFRAAAAEYFPGISRAPPTTPSPLREIARSTWQHSDRGRWGKERRQTGISRDRGDGLRHASIKRGDVGCDSSGRDLRRVACAYRARPDRIRGRFSRRPSRSHIDRRPSDPSASSPCVHSGSAAMGEVLSRMSTNEKATGQARGTITTTDEAHGPRGKPELPQPQELKCKFTLETSFENKKELTVTGGFSGGSDWIANLEASLQVASGYTETTKPTIGLKAEVTARPCEWQDMRAFQRVCVGKQSRVRIKCQPCWNVTKISNGRSYEYHGPVIEGTATLTCDMAINGSMSIKTTANGRCPRP